MRQFNYQYKSYMKNRHGFLNMIPHAKFLHSAMGYTGAQQHVIFQDQAHPEYSKRFSSTFLESSRTFQHKVKIFFPEIKHGVVLVSEAKYSVVKAKEEDEVSITSTVAKGNKYEEYYAIEDFIVEFVVDIHVDFGLRASLTAPAEVYCDFIDIYIHNQKISITVHENNLLFVPYLMSYRADRPFEVARLETNFTNNVVSSDLQYGFIIDDETRNVLEEKNLVTSAMDMSLLNTKKRISGMIDDAGGDSGSFVTIDSLKGTYGGVKQKHIFLLPQAIFPDKLTLKGLPVFDSEIVRSCCDYYKWMLGSPYFKLYDIPIPLEIDMPVPCDKTPEECQDMLQYELKNLVIEGSLILSDKGWDELDRLALELENDKIKTNILEQV